LEYIPFLPPRFQMDLIIRSWKGTHSWEGRRVSCTRNVFQTETGEQTTLKARVVRMVRGDGGLMKVGRCSFRRHRRLVEVARGSLGCRTDTRFTPLALIGDGAFASSLEISQWLKSWKERRRTGRQLSTYLERMELIHHHSWQESSIVPKSQVRV